MKLIGNFMNLSTLLTVLSCLSVTHQLPDLLEGDKVSNSKFNSDSQVSGYDKAHKSHKEADSDGWKNLKSLDKGKLEKGKQDEEMYLGEGKHKAKKVNGFHSESGGHKSKDKGLNKKWNRGDGLMKTWNWNKGGHLEEEEGGKWRTSVHHQGQKGKKLGSSKEIASDADGSHYESSKKKDGSVKESGKKMERHKKKEKMAKKFKSQGDRSSSKMDEKKIEQMKFNKYEKPMHGWNNEDEGFKAKSSFHPSSYKGVDHGSIHGGRLSSLQNHHFKEKLIKKEKKDDDDFVSMDGDDLPDELKSLEKELGD